MDKFTLYSKCHWKSLKGFKQGENRSDLKFERLLRRKEWKGTGQEQKQREYCSGPLWPK